MIDDRHIARLPRGDAIALLRSTARNRRLDIAGLEADTTLDDATRRRRLNRQQRALRIIRGVARRASIDVDGPG